jgi:hypothetical protein
MATATLSQRIQLEGGDKIRVELERIGKAAGDALAKLKGGSTGAVPAQQDLNKELAKTREELEGVKQSSEGAGEGLLSLRTKMLLVAGAITAGVAGWIALAKAAADSAVEQKNAADKIGVSLRQLREVEGIGRVFGVSADTMQNALKGITEALVKGGDISKRTTAGFTEISKGWFKLGTEIEATAIELGRFYQVEETGRRRFVLATEANRAEIALKLTQRAINGVSSSLSESERFLNNFVGGLAKFRDKPLDAFQKIAEELEKIKDPAKRAFLITKLGLESVSPLLTAGVEEFKKYREALKDLSVFEPLSEQQTVAAEDFIRILTTIQAGIARKTEQTRTAFYGALVSPLDEVLIEMRLRAKPIEDVLFQLARSAGSLAGDIIRAFFPRVDADTGKLVFGLNEDTISDTNKWVLTLRDTVVQFGRDVYNSVGSIVIPAWRGFLAIVTTVTTAINGFLGTKFGSFEILAGGILLKLTGLFKLLGGALGGLIGVFAGFGKAALVAGAAILAFGASGFDAIPTAVLDAAAKTKKEGDGFLAYVQRLVADIGNAFRFNISAGGDVTFIDTEKVSEANGWVIRLRDTIISFKDDVISVGQSVIAVWTKVTDVFNHLFNTKFSPGQLGILLALAQMTGFLTLLVSLTVGLNALVGIITAIAKAFIFLGGIIFGLSLPWAAFWAVAIAGALALAALFRKELFDAILNATKGLLDFSSGPVKGVGQDLGKVWDQFKSAASSSISFAEQKLRDLGRFKLSVDASEALTAAANASAALDRYKSKLDAIKTIKFPKPTGGDTGTGLSDRNDIEDDLKDVIEATEDAAKGFAPVGKAADAAADVVSKAFQEIATQVTSLPTTIIDEEQFVSPFRRIVEVVTELFAVQLPAALQSAANSISDIMSDLASSVEETLARIEEALARARAAASETSSLGGGGGGGEGFATGGYVRGSGSGTSDSIPAWLSNGEFVIRAAAVKQYGLSFLRAVNGMRLNPSRMKLGMPAFAMGGLVDTSARIAPPAVGGGGGTMPGAAFNLFIGGEAFGTVYAPENTAANLQRFASSAQTRSLGRKPGWYK